MTRKALFSRAPRRGFTLIELLIVIAIVLILIAIALPNYLEAQIRAKVTQTESEIRSIAGGLEAYQTDWNRYPPAATLEPAWCGAPPLGPFRCSLMQLTTPIPYLTEIPQDPFCPIGYWPSDVRPPSPADKMYGHGYVYWTPESQAWPLKPRDLPADSCEWVQTRNGAPYTVISLAPDMDADFLGLAGASCADPDYGLRLRLDALPWYYSPTNGTRSNGDIVRRRPYKG